MAEDNQDRAREADAERQAEIEAELERVGQDPDQVREGTDSLGKQSSATDGPRVDEEGDPIEEEEDEEERLDEDGGEE